MSNAARPLLKTGHTNAVELSKPPVSTAFVRTEVDPGSRCSYISHLVSQLGTMSVELSIDHPIAAMRSTMASYPDIDVALGAAETRYYGTGYRNVHIAIQGLVVDRERQSASASIGLSPPARVQISSGMGSGYAPVHTRLKKTSIATGNGKHWRTNAFGVEFPRR